MNKKWLFCDVKGYTPALPGSFSPLLNSFIYWYRVEVEIIMKNVTLMVSCKFEPILHNLPHQNDGKFIADLELNLTH